MENQSPEKIVREMIKANPTYVLQELFGQSDDPSKFNIELACETLKVEKKFLIKWGVENIAPDGAIDMLCGIYLQHLKGIIKKVRDERSARFQKAAV